MALPSNTTINRYGAIAAEIYDLDKPPGALPDTAFHLQRLSGVDGEILEPACGSGRTLLPLLQAGHRAAGFEPSPDMLERCRALCAAHGYQPDLTSQTFEDFRYDRTFAAILVPVGTFTLIDDFDAALAVLRRFREALAPGGVAILDIQPLSFLQESRDDLREWTAENGDLLTLHGQRVRADWLRQRVDYRIRYERWRDGRLVESELEPMRQRYWGLEEFALALKAAGFAEVSVTGGYARRPPRSNDRVLTFEAVRG